MSQNISRLVMGDTYRLCVGSSCVLDLNTFVHSFCPIFLVSHKGLTVI